jgi:hypothetical protein
MGHDEDFEECIDLSRDHLVAPVPVYPDADRGD